MKVPWPVEKCILCHGDATLSEEHLIPEALGGKLTADFLCALCNSELGRNLESNAKSDPSVIMSAKIMAHKFPPLASRIVESHPHIAYSDNGPAMGYFKDGDFRIKSQKLENGSIIQPTDLARKTLFKLLNKSKCQELTTQQAIPAFDDAPYNKRVEIAQGLEAIKWRVDRLEIDLAHAQSMDLLIPVKIAFEFLACHLGPAVYGDVPPLSQVKSALMKKKMNTDVLLVERLTSNKYEPFHGIVFEGNDPYAKVQVRLFGWLAFRVHFLHLSVSGPRYVYTHRLDSGEETIAETGA